MAAEAWRVSKKLTLLDEVPDKPRDLAACLSVPELKDESIGYLEYWDFRILQILGPKDLLLAIPNPDIPPIWLAGYSTKGLADGDRARLVGLIKVDGTKSYTGVAGGKHTVRVVRLVPPEEAAAIKAAKKKAAEDAAKKKAAEEKLFRTWTSADGRFTVEAKFLGFRDGRVHLEKRNGSHISVKPWQLSKADCDHYREVLRRRHRESLKERDSTE